MAFNLEVPVAVHWDEFGAATSLVQQNLNLSSDFNLFALLSNQEIQSKSSM